MKKIGLMLTVALFTLGTMTTMQSCKNECKDVTCNNAGTCNEDDGTCDCTAGYDGEFCDDEWRADAIGSFAVADNCQSGTYNYDNNITAGSAVLDFLFSNLGNFTSNAGQVKATMDDGSTFTIASQTDGEGRTFVGSGTTNSSGIVTVTYTVTFSDSTTDDCTATYTPK